MIVAHIAGFPLEELLALAPVAGACWLALRGHIHRRVGGGSPRRDPG
jgi:hypothetical protein